MKTDGGFGGPTGPSTAMSKEMIDSSIDEMLSSLCERRMVLPAALFLAGHRPMAFTIGQLLLVLQPLAGLLGENEIGAWGRLLSHPAGPAALGDRLAELMDEEKHTGPERRPES